MSGVWSRGVGVPTGNAGSTSGRKNAWGGKSQNAKQHNNNNNNSRSSRGGHQQRSGGNSRAHYDDSKDFVKKIANPVKKVAVSGQAVLQIVKQCHKALPELASGAILGLDIDDKMEVTHSFPLPGTSSSDDSEYTLGVMRLLRDINVDNCCVGWYTSCNMGTFCTEDFVKKQFEYQETIQDSSGHSKSIALVYDPEETSKRGALELRAYRLSETFVEEWRRKKDAEEIYAISTKMSDILEELPVEITNPSLINVFLNDIRAEKKVSVADNSYDTPELALDLSSHEFLEKKIEHLMKEVDNLTMEHMTLDKADYEQKSLAKNREKWIENRKAENELRAKNGEPLLPETEPHLELFQKKKYNCSKVEFKLIQKQLDVFCSQIDNFTGASFGKLFLTESLQK